MTYEERVRQTAERMAKINSPYAFNKWIQKGKTSSYYDKWRHCIDAVWELSKESVAMQAEAIREAFSNCEAARCINPDNNWEEYLRQNGYIPEKEEE